jgi:hypothetical protein
VLACHRLLAVGKHVNKGIELKKKIELLPFYIVFVNKYCFGTDSTYTKFVAYKLNVCNCWLTHNISNIMCTYVYDLLPHQIHILLFSCFLNPYWARGRATCKDENAMILPIQNEWTGAHIWPTGVTYFPDVFLFPFLFWDFASLIALDVYFEKINQVKSKHITLDRSWVAFPGIPLKY